MERIQVELHLGGARALGEDVGVEVGIEERPRGTELEPCIDARPSARRCAAEGERGRADEIRHLVGHGIPDDRHGVHPARGVIDRAHDVEGVAVGREEDPAEVRWNVERGPRRPGR